MSDWPTDLGKAALHEYGRRMLERGAAPAGQLNNVVTPDNDQLLVH